MNTLSNLKSFARRLGPSASMMASIKSKITTANLFKISLAVIICTIIQIVKYLGKTKAKRHTIILPDKSKKDKKSIQNGFRIIFTMEDAIKNKKIHDIHNPENITNLLEAIRNCKRSNQGSLFNTTINNRYCNPMEMLTYNCLVITEALMQESFGIQYKADDKNKDDVQDSKKNSAYTKATLSKDLELAFSSLLGTIEDNKSHIKTLSDKMKEDSYETLLSMKKLCEDRYDKDLNTNPKYEEEFLKNLNIILYMVSREDLDNVDKNFSKRVKEEICPFFSEKENINLIKTELVITERQSQRMFCEAFERITK